MRHETAFNPLDKENLGKSVADALLERPTEPLPPSEGFIGAGVYAIYYTGDYPAYAQLAEKNRDGEFAQPIYVGRAIPAGARRGGFGLGASPGTVLHRRLFEHGQSVAQASNLAQRDFFCRYLVVDDIWIPLGESLLIEMFSPVWNRLVDGFGNHDPGAGRRNQQRSAWDLLHPGRPWADLLQPHPRSEEDVLQRVEAYLRDGT